MAPAETGLGQLLEGIEMSDRFAIARGVEAVVESAYKHPGGRIDFLEYFNAAMGLWNTVEQRDWSRSVINPKTRKERRFSAQCGIGAFGGFKTDVCMSYQPYGPHGETLELVSDKKRLVLTRKLDVYPIRVIGRIESLQPSEPLMSLQQPVSHR